MNIDQSFLDVLGTIAQLAGFIIVGIWFFAQLDSRMKQIDETRKRDHEANQLRFKEIEKQLERLVDVTVALGRQDERLTSLDNRLNEVVNRVENLRSKREIVRAVPSKKRA